MGCGVEEFNGKTVEKLEYGGRLYVGFKLPH